MLRCLSDGADRPEIRRVVGRGRREDQERGPPGRRERRRQSARRRRVGDGQDYRRARQPRYPHLELARSARDGHAARHRRADHDRAAGHGPARARLQGALDAGEIVVVAGFQGLSEVDEITTLGRGGSDLTAVALAAALKADVCEIYTDVDGVYTADPNIVPEARKLPRIAYDEMLEMASLGAKVLQARSVEFAKKYGVPVHVRSTFKPVPGTLVTREERDMEEVVVTGVTHDRSQAKISILRVPDRPGIAAQVFGAIAGKNMVVDMIVQNISRDGYTDMSFTVPRGDYARAVEALEHVARQIGAAGIVHDERVAKVS